LRSKNYKPRQKIQAEDYFVGSASSELSYSFNPDKIGVKEKLDTLTPANREVIDVVYYNGFTHKEAAEKLDLPLGTIKSRLRIAIRELRNIFGIEHT